MITNPGNRRRARAQPNVAGIGKISPASGCRAGCNRELTHMDTKRGWGCCGFALLQTCNGGFPLPVSGQPVEASLPAMTYSGRFCRGNPLAGAICRKPVQNRQKSRKTLLIPLDIPLRSRIFAVICRKNRSGAIPDNSLKNCHLSLGLRAVRRVRIKITNAGLSGRRDAGAEYEHSRSLCLQRPGVGRESDGQVFCCCRCVCCLLSGGTAPFKCAKPSCTTGGSSHCRAATDCPYC
jgi:hypothetical protein